MKTQITISRYVILVSFALFAAGPALTQNSSETFPEEHAQAVTPAPPIAYVYVGTAQGVFLYDTAASGQLSLVYGSPFQTTGLMAGSNGPSTTRPHRHRSRGCRRVAAFLSAT